MYKVILILIASLMNVTAQLSLKKGMNIHGEILYNHGVLYSLVKLLKNPYIWGGGIAYVMGFFLFLYILSKYQLSYVYPVLVGTIFFFMLIFSSFLLGEAVTIHKFIGIACILLGIFIISYYC